MLDALDADAVRRWYEGGLDALDVMRDEINSLNVFPVADADTGTNLHLTLGSAVGGSAIAQEAAHDDLAATARAMARESLLGARGSSGVILSQLLRGVAEVLSEQRLPPRGEGLTRALERAVALAYAAVAHPVEGTMLTVARAAAEAARATGSDDLHAVVAAAVGAAHRALAQTPDQLDVLGRAGVVDAGGRGVVLLLDVLQAVVEERALVMPRPSIARPRPSAATPPIAVPAYEVMYLIDVADDLVPGLRIALDAIGDSVVISGGGELWNVHVHTDDAGAAIDAGIAVGHAHRIRVTPIDVGGAVDDGVRTRSLDDADATHVVLLVIDRGSALDVVCDTLVAAGGVLARDDANSGADAVLLVDTVSGASSAADDLTVLIAAQRRVIERVDVDSPIAAFAALAVHDPTKSITADAEAMAAAARAVRCARVQPESDAAAADQCMDTLQRLIDESSELVTVVADAKVVAPVENRIRLQFPKVQLTSVVAVGAADIWLGVE